ncbi:hypothetical protein ABH922_000080 [Rhodococcus sp. 27YEA15]|uniref:hypothetical protein n=1 Tax=Rhodococcus sp. 27YEA15 TaxID=3156259 RepID=UPI003C7D0983
MATPVLVKNLDAVNVRTVPQSGNVRTMPQSVNVRTMPQSVNVRTMPLSQYLSEHPIDRAFPSTSERVAKIAMLTMFGLMALTVLLLVLDETGLLG